MNKHSNFTFIDLFAGIGGIRIAFEAVGGDCVFSSEYDKYSQITYEKFFGERPDFSTIIEVDPPGDITKINADYVPNHDILTGGFPCQPFSLAGVSKKNSLGKPHGFDDLTKGTLFFNIKEIIDKKRPLSFMLENVKNLTSHDKGRTFRIIKETLDKLNYSVFVNIIDAQYWVPQHRERIYIVGFRKPEADPSGSQNWSVDHFTEFTEMKMPKRRLYELDELLEDSPPKLAMLPPGTWKALIKHKEYHEEAGNGFGFGLIKKPFHGEITRTLSARYHKDGAEILIDMEWERPRKLTPLECCKLMGFPKKYWGYYSKEKYVNNSMHVSKTQAYRQFGNSVVVPVVETIASKMKTKLIEVGAI